MTALPRGGPGKKLGLVVDLDICVGCHACAVSCKAWNGAGGGVPPADSDPYGENPGGRFSL